MKNVNRLKGKNTEAVSVFHGRDLFSYCAAKLASGLIDFEGVGPAYSVEEIVMHLCWNPRSVMARLRGFSRSMTRTSAMIGPISPPKIS